MSLAPLIAKAKTLLKRAYAPYSRFPVAAVLRGGNGKLYAGCNVENAAYPVGWCAETSAIAAMIADGEKRIKEVLVMGKGDELCTPCGACRQRLREFGAPGMKVHVAGPEGLRQTFTLAELLPASFGPDNLKHGKLK